MIDSGAEIKREIDLASYEIKSRNYGSLFEAMGPEKYQAFRNLGQGVDNLPNKLKSSLEKSQFHKATYTSGEYVEEGEIKNSVFMEQDVGNGTKCLFVIDVDKSKPNNFRLSNLFVSGDGGSTVDLLEELEGEGTESYVSAFANAAFDVSSDRFYFGDLNRLSKNVGYETNIGFYIHEIGHFKDNKQNGNVQKLDSFPVRKHVMLALARDWEINFGKGVAEKIFGENITEAFYKDFGEYMNLLLGCEKEASDYAKAYLLIKKSEGVNLIPELSDEQVADSLNYALTTYENQDGLGLYGHTEVNPNNLRKVGNRKFSNSEELSELVTLLGIWKDKFSRNGT